MLEKYKKICNDIAVSMPEGGIWQWEDRFGVALTVFEKVDMVSVMNMLGHNFDHQWSSEKMASGTTAGIDLLIEQMFGIEPGQLLFSRDSDSGLVLFAAWWPWANGVSISLRVGMYVAGSGLEVDVAGNLKEWFRI